MKQIMRAEEVHGYMGNQNIEDVLKVRSSMVSVKTQNVMSFSFLQSLGEK